MPDEREQEQEPWSGFAAFQRAFEAAPACHHDHDRVARQAAEFLVSLEAADAD